MKRAVVIGAGVGGSAIAALLAGKGLNVTVLERNTFAGGKAAGYDKDGFIVDHGVHACGRGSRGPLDEVARRSGAKLEFAQPRPVIRIMTPKRNYDFNGNLITPVSLIRLLLLTGIRPRNIPGAARVLWKVIKIKTEGDAEAYDDMTVREFLSRYTDDQGFHSFCDLYAGLMLVVDADEASAGEFLWSLSSMMKDDAMGYPKGAFRQISRSYLEACRERGGQVFLNTEAKNIRVEDGKVTGVEAGGVFYPADVVVSDAGLKKTVELAGRENFPAGYLERIDGLRDSDGGVTLKLALDKKPFEAPAVFYLPDNLNIKKNMEEMERGEVPEDLPIFMPCPTNFDSSLAPEGKHLLLAGTIVPTEMAVPGTAEKILDRIEQQVYSLFPGIKEHVLWKHRTDLDYINTLGGRAGEVIGLAQTWDQVGRNKPDARMPVEGLYLVGCDAGGRGIGTEQAADSALKVSEMIAGA